MIPLHCDLNHSFDREPPTKMEVNLTSRIMDLDTNELKQIYERGVDLNFKDSYVSFYAEKPRPSSALGELFKGSPKKGKWNAIR